MSTSRIELACLDWKPCTNNEDNREKIEAYFQGQKLDNFCPFNANEKLYKRIGSPSANAEVYLYTLPKSNVQIACKVVPYKSEYNKRKILDEININKYLYDQDPESYPQIYGFIVCDQIILKPTSYLVEVKKFNIVSKGIIILYELLAFDFRQLIRCLKTYNLIDNEFTVKLINNIVDLIINLNKEGIKHGDLHTGNIMFRCKKFITYQPGENIMNFYEKFLDNITPVIIDFGLSENIQKNSKENFQDLYHFMHMMSDSLGKDTYLGQAFLNSFENLLDFERETLTIDLVKLALDAELNITIQKIQGVQENIDEESQEDTDELLKLFAEIDKLKPNSKEI